MIQLSANHFLDKLQETYYQKVLMENLDYVKRNGMFYHACIRIYPQLDAIYYHSMKNWLENEFNMIYDVRNGLFLFENEKDAILFKLGWE